MYYKKVEDTPIADLSQTQATEVIRLVGSSVGGTETNLLAVDSFQTAQVGLYGPTGSAVTTVSNGLAGNIVLHVQTPDTVTASTALGALNATVSISMAGTTSVGFQILSGTLIGTLLAECSIDGGTTWAACNFYDPSNATVTSSVVFASANTTKVLSIIPIGGASNVRVRVSAYASGTANSLLRASNVTGVAGTVTSAAFGTVVNTTVTLTAATATLLLAANVNRKYAYISNNSAQSIAIRLGSPTGLTSAQSGRVIVSGGVYDIGGSNLYTGAIYGWGSSAGLIISVTEGTP